MKSIALFSKTTALFFAVIISVKAQPLPFNTHSKELGEKEETID